MEPSNAPRHLPLLWLHHPRGFGAAAVAGETGWGEWDLAAVATARAELERRKVEHTGPLTLMPGEPLPPPGTLGFRVQRYGME